MISEISLTNFKGFGHLEDLKIKPVTILCGVNSSGKSSILQSILLIKQTLESQNPDQTLLLNGRFVHLGTFENIIFQKDLDKTISFDMSFVIKEPLLVRKRQRTKPPLSTLLRGLISPESLHDRTSELHIQFKVSLMTKKERVGRNFLRFIIVKELTSNFQTTTPDGKITPGASLEMALHEDDVYLIKWRGIRTRNAHSTGKLDAHEIKGEVSAEVHFANITPLSIEIEESHADDQSRFAVPFYFHRLSELMKAIFSSYSYIGPLREEPSRRYIYEDEILEIGLKGENAAYIYLAEQYTDVNKHYFYDESTDSFVLKQRRKLSVAVQDWLSSMNIHRFKPEAVNEIIYLNLDSTLSSETRVNIADVGFGVSQIFPIILEGLRMQSGNTLVLEQPEIHLHPNLQMQMADYFIALALSEKKVIVETHSDHVVNRLVRRIIEDDRGLLSDLIGIYFFKSTPYGAEFEEIKIDETSGIVNWPRDFFDQTATEQERIMRAGLKKRKDLRKND